MIGISIAWNEEPPSEVRVGQRFNVSYHIEATNHFYESLFGFHLSSYNINSSDDLKTFCHSSLCPPEMASLRSFKEDCCVWHANIHVCHPGNCGQPVRQSYQTNMHTLQNSTLHCIA